MRAINSEQRLHHKVFRLCCGFKPFVVLLVFLCARAVCKANPGESIGKKGVVLVIKHGRFRGDIEMLRASGRFQYLKLPNVWPGRFYRWFYGMSNVHDSYRDNRVRSQQEQYRRFLRLFLPLLFKKLSVKMLMNSGINYKVAVDWTAIAGAVATPSVVFHREGYMGSQHEQNHLLSFGKDGRRFEGTKLVLQTELQRSKLMQGGFVESENSVAIGTLRFDKLFQDKGAKNKVDSGRKEWVTFFSFGVSTGFLTTSPPYWPLTNEVDYLYEFARLTHVAVAKFALDNPNVKVLIKTKWGGNWFDKVHEFLESGSLSLDEIPNLFLRDIVDDVGAQIERSRVVVGYGSTTLLESAIAGVPVIVPLFAEIAEARMRDYVCYPDIFECFDVASSPIQLRDLIEMRYKSANNKLGQEIMEKRLRAFERYISPTDGASGTRAEQLIREYWRTVEG